MQITIPEEDVKLFREIFQVLIWPAAGWIARRGFKALKEALNEMITDNVNRIKLELVEHIDARFLEHEKSAFGRLDNLKEDFNGKFKRTDSGSIRTVGTP